MLPQCNTLPAIFSPRPHKMSPRGPVHRESRDPEHTGYEHRRHPGGRRHNGGDPWNPCPATFGGTIQTSSSFIPGANLNWNGVVFPAVLWSLVPPPARAASGPWTQEMSSREGQACCFLLDRYYVLRKRPHV